MGEIYVKKNNAFERVVSDGNTVIINSGGGGGGGVTIAFHARQTEATDGSNYIPFSSTTYPIDGSMPNPSATSYQIHFRNLSKYLDVLDVNTNSLGNGQPFDSDSGVYTAKVAGVYRFTASATVGLNQSNSVSTDNSSSFWMWLRKNPQNPDSILNFNADRVGSVLFVARDDEQSASQSIDIHHPSHTWEVELQAGDRIVLCAAWFKGNQNEETATPPQQYRVWVGDAAFSGSYVGGASVTPRDPVAVYATVGRALIGTENPNIPSGSGNLLPKIYKFDGQSTRVCNQIFLPTEYSTFTESSDKSNAFNPSTGVFVAPVKGVYSIGFDISVFDQDPDDAHWYSFWIQKTGVSVTIPDSAASFRGNPVDAYANDVRREGKFGDALYSDQNYQWLVEMEAGEKITWHMLGSNANNHVNAIRLSAHLLTSTQTIDPPLETPVAFSVMSTTNLGNLTGAAPLSKRIRNGIMGTSTLGNRPFALREIFDTVGCYDPSTGIFTAPSTGVYSFCFDASVANGSYLLYWLEKTPAGQTPGEGTLPVDGDNNGIFEPVEHWDDHSLANPRLVGNYLSFSDNSLNYQNTSGNWTVQLNAGDQITWHIGKIGPTAGSTNINNMSFGGKLIAATENNVKMSRGSAPAMIASAPLCSNIKLSTNEKKFKNSNLTRVTVDYNGADTWNETNSQAISTTACPGNITSFEFTKQLDTHSSFDPITGIFTAPIKGIYEVQMNFVLFEGSLPAPPPEDVSQPFWWIQKTPFGGTVPADGSGNKNNAVGNFVYQNASAQNFDRNPMHGRWLVELEAGDMITWHCNKTAQSGDTSFVQNITLSAHLLTSTETVFSDGNPDVLFAFHTKNTDETLGGGGVVLNGMVSYTNYLLRTGGTGQMELAGTASGVEVTDLTSSFDPATGKFTAPISGWYELDGQVDWHPGGDAVQRLYVWMEKNNTTDTPLVNAGVVTDPEAANHLINRRVEHLATFRLYNASQNIKNIVYLSQGETVALCVYGSAANNRPIITHWSFSGKRIPPVNSSSGIGAGTVYSDYSATENGWTRIAPGVIMQWGSYTFTAGDNSGGNGAKLISFPKAFTGTPWSINTSAKNPLNLSSNDWLSVSGDKHGQYAQATPTGMYIIIQGNGNSSDNVNGWRVDYTAIGPG